MTATITPAALRDRLLAAEGERALLDVREAGAFGRGHLLLASNAPLSRLEIEVPRLVPRRATPIVLCDGGDGLAERAAGTLAGCGYSDLTVLAGGVGGWREAGFQLFDGINVPSKAFGELVEATCATPHVTAKELAGLRARGRELVVLDSRPMDEYRRMCIPGGIDVPGAELVHRIHDLAPDPRTLVVVNCAGRTRSIVGAQSLIDAGVPNPVVALENGTMGWTLAGLELEHGGARVAPPLTEAGRAWAREAVARVAARFGVATIDLATLARWRAEEKSRTLYLCDVRSPEERERGHVPGSRATPGGQLVQATDGFIGTRGARVVLIDDDGVRATMTASWLKRMGWPDVHVLADGLAGELERGPERVEVLGLDEAAAVPTIGPSALAAAIAGGEAQVLDLATSRAFRDGHVPGAWWVSRPRLEQALVRIPAAGAWVLTSPDGILARLAAPEVERVAGVPVRALEGGTEAWRAAGHALASGEERMTSEPDDVHLRPYDLDRPDEVERAMHAYIAWETALVPQVERDGTLRFEHRS